MDKEKSKQEKNKLKNLNIKDISLNIILIIFAIMIIVSIYNIIKWYISIKQANEIISEISDKVNIIEENDNTDYKINFEELKKNNPDVVAWLKVNNTKIEYPIVKGTNNEYYLAHSFDKKENLAGWIFADYRNKFDETDKNIIIYGHNMRDGSMFCTLKDVIKPEWYENQDNHKITFVTEQGEFEYQVFSVYKIEEEDFNNKTSFESVEKFTKYITAVKNRSIYNFNIEVTQNDEILTLATCADNNRYRIILHAKKISG